ncbi:HPP family protein [Polaribacter sp. HaHaR_3_91]|jgi:CBS-domain-containing membrane protein|uniref:HPP family protein n=1 Tax=Polaribacter sp. HaHaR_3_91 TaxID=2745561 RepID=UPI001C4EE9AC|nr:HPP family protein [Polaribacter sp. HaHaR_3_91]QXP62629.1 HPP family protein [Polaribacter sp. HaHaR_3_91]
MVQKKIKRTYRLTKYIIYKETLIDYKEKFWSFIGAFIGIGIIAFIQSLSFTKVENIFLIGSFGASSVLIYGAIQSPYSQPRNLIGGHLLSAFVGISVLKICPDIIWISAPLAVSASIILMQYTKTLHPPGGATALIPIIGTEKITSLGYFYMLSPVLSGVLILLITALIFSNMTKNRSYPTNKMSTRIFKTKKRLAKILPKFGGK